MPEPRSDLSSTGYLLANPSEKCLILQPSDTVNPFMVTLEAGIYTVEWFSINSRETQLADNVTVESSMSVSFTPPLSPAGPVVLYLKAEIN